MTATTSAPSRTSAASGRTRTLRTTMRSAWNDPAMPYYLISVLVLVTVALGLVFVLSSSAVKSLSRGNAPYDEFFGQAQFALIGLPLAFAVSRLPVDFLKKFAWVAYFGALGLQLTPFFLEPVTANGNIVGVILGPITFQPGEFAKVGLVLWLGAVLANKQHQLGKIRHLLVPVLGSALMIAAQLKTEDMGTSLVLVAIVAGSLFVAGVPLRIFAGLGVAALGVIAFLSTLGQTRLARIMAVFQPGEVDSQGVGWQLKQSLWALGTGGVSGVGLGGSRTKWLHLPEAHNDFILAVIGEELGLLGILLVLILFGLLMVGLTRIVTLHPNPFVKIATGAVSAWVLFQAVVNIGMVIGVLPVIGIPLPLISTGGSSLIATLIAFGIVLAFARDLPGAKARINGRRGATRRSFALLARGRRAV